MTINVQRIKQAVSVMLGAIALALCMVQAGYAQADLLQNSGFESNTTGNFNGSGVPTAGVPFWHSAQNTVVISNATPDYDSNFNPIYNNYAVLDSSNQLRSIDQHVSLVKGDTYTLTFAYGVAQHTNATTNNMLVQVSGAGNTNLLSNKIAGGNPFSGSFWSDNKFSFVAASTGAVDVLFKAIGVANNSVAGTTFVDNINLSVTPVPEASTVLLFGLLMVGGIAMLRRRLSASPSLA